MDNSFKDFAKKESEKQMRDITTCMDMHVLQMVLQSGEKLMIPEIGGAILKTENQNKLYL